MTFLKIIFSKTSKGIKDKAIFGGDGAVNYLEDRKHRQKVSNYFSNNSDYTKYIDWGIKFSNSKYI